MVSAGKYDWVNSDITPGHFPVKGSGQEERKIALFHFGRAMTSEQAIAKMDKAGYRPAKTEGLLSLGASQPGLQKQFPIVAVGSVWQRSRGSRRVPDLDWGDVRGAA